MSHKPFRIDLSKLPSDGKDIEGTLQPAFFELDPKDPIKATGPLNYVLHIERDENDIILTGELTADFELECGRCLTRFPYRAEMPNYLSDVPIEKEDATIDLTNTIREDILVALPGYPRCEDGNVEPRACPAEGKFEVAADAESDEEPSKQGTDVWNVLDQLKKR